MKTLLLGIALVFGTKAFAISVDDFCSQFSWDSEKIQCHKTANQGFIDTNALDVCQTLSFDSDKMNCLNPLMNKTYTQGEVKTCRDTSFDSDKINCLKELGKKYDPPTDRRVDNIRKLTITAQDSLRRNDIYSAQRLLDQILQLTGY